jgi:hypothetical protein
LGSSAAVALRVPARWRRVQHLSPPRPRHVILSRIWACQREGPGRCWQQRRGPFGVRFGGASVRRRQRRFERRLPRRLWRSRWARRFPMAEPACWAISSRKARSGSRRISKRYPTSSHHKDRVHTLAPRPTRGIGFKGGTGGMKKRPACARRSASGAPCWAHSDDYMPKCDDRSSHRSNSLVNGGRSASGLCPHSVNPAPRITVVLA